MEHIPVSVSPSSSPPTEALPYELVVKGERGRGKNEGRGKNKRIREE